MHVSPGYETLLSGSTASRPLTPLMSAGDTSPILFRVVERRAAWMAESEDKLPHPFPDYKALVRVNGQSPMPLCFVGKDFQLVQMRDILYGVETVMQETILPEYLQGVTIKDTSSNYGRNVFRQYIFPNLKCVHKRPGRDKGAIAFRLLCHNGYGGSAIKLLFGAIDFYCTNGMIVGEFEHAYFRHTKRFTLDGITNCLRRGVDDFVMVGARLQRWMDTPVPHEKALTFLKAIASSPRQFDKLAERAGLEMRDRGENLWAVYSTLTHYASHADGAFKARDTHNDSVGMTMLQREQDVRKWIATPQFRVLETVC